MPAPETPSRTKQTPAGAAISGIANERTGMPETRAASTHPAPSLVQLGRRVLLALGLTALVLIALWLWLSWQSLKQIQLQRMTVAVSLAANQARAYFDTLGTNLETLALRLQQAGVPQRADGALALLQEFRDRHPDLGGATLILPSGQIIASTAHKAGTRLPNVLENPAWRGDFHHNLEATGLSINQPQKGYLLNTWLLPLRYTVRDADDRPLFVLQTSVVLERQQAMWANLGLLQGAQIGLVREDGVLLSIWPLQGGRPFDQHGLDLAPLMASTQKNASNGFFELGGTSWRQHRFGVYQRLPRYPVYSFISASNPLLLGMWWQTVRIPIYVLLALAAMAVATYGVLAARFMQRMQAIRGALDQRDRDTPLPTSGVREIDDLCAALVGARSALEQAAKNRERQLISAARAGTYTVRLRDGVIVQADDAFLAMLDRTREEVVGRAWSTLCEDEGEPAEDRANGGGLTLRVLKLARQDGTPVWLSLAEYLDAYGAEPLRQGLAIDVSERELLLSKVRRHSERLRALWTVATDRELPDADKATQMLQLGVETLGMEAGLIGEVGDGVYHIRHLVDRLWLFGEVRSLPLMDTLCAAVLRRKQSLFECNLMEGPEFRQHPTVVDMGLRSYASTPIWVGEHLYGTLVFLSRKPHAGPFSDEDRAFVEILASWFGRVLAEQRQHAVLEAMAMTDSLTGLPNRRAAEDRFSGELARARRASQPFAIAVCDLDRFKLINDHFGHDVGDDVLRHVARIMGAVLREGDWVARWGGEEFLIFLHESDDASAYHAMERLREEIKAQPLVSRHGNLAMTASIGIGVYRAGDTEITRVLAEADGCLYEAKRRGRDRVVASDSVGRGTLWQAGMLQRALQENRVCAAYQVMVDLRTGRPVAEEALARLVLPDGEILPAADFVEAAEGIQLIHIVDDLVARDALARCCDGREADGGRPLVHFINLSPQFLARKELLDALLEEARRHAERSALNFGHSQPIVFEITERQLLEDFGSTRRDLQRLLDYGFRLALDDFGSGYSSFLYLAELPISFIKIEGWMVRNMRHNERVLSMVRSVVVLAKTLNITTIAECIEDEETADILREMGVDWGQGFLFGHPVFAAPPGTRPLAPGSQY
jgi:diguanylate cyclase (GGDEF)-like protein